MIMSRAAMLAARSLTRSRTVMKNGFSSDDLGEKKGSFSCVAVEVSVHELPVAEDETDERSVKWE